VLKSDAYGHGIKNIFSGLSKSYGIAVLDINEAILLREIGWSKPIMLLEGIFDLSDIEQAVKHNLIIVIHSEYQIKMIDDFSAINLHMQIKISVFLKMNTGMNRLGIPQEKYLTIYKKLKTKTWLVSLTHMTHFAKSDHPCGIDEQLKKFNTIVQHLPEEKSISNSGAILWHKSAHYDSVRAGIALYGASPSGCYEQIQNINLRPAMHLETKIIGIQNINQGECVGYGARFIAPKNMRIAIIACGYADGYPRHAPDGTPIIIDGHTTQIVGKVSMDMITADITDINQANIGSTVQLWGDILPIDKVAQACGTIGYELMCAVAPRVSRIKI
jgi:alanine racemase